MLHKIYRLETINHEGVYTSGKWTEGTKQSSYSSNRQPNPYHDVKLN